MEAYSPVEDVDKHVPILIFMKLVFPRIFSEFHLGKRRGGTLLKCFLNWKFFGGGIKAIHLRPLGLDFFFRLFVPKGGGSFIGDLIENPNFQLSIGELFTRMISLLDQIPETLFLILNLMED